MNGMARIPVRTIAQESPITPAVITRHCPTKTSIQENNGLTLRFSL